MIRLLAASLFLTLIANSVFATAAAAPNPLASLRAEHPRLIAAAADWAALKVRVERDPALAAYHAHLIAEARSLLAATPVERTMTGRRLLGVSRTLLQRVMLLGYAWRTSGNPVFAHRAETEMLAAAEFSDWNPTHFLDVGEATAALALGYDWCHDALSPESRAQIRTAIVEKGLQPGADPKASYNGWQRTRNNWNQVCFGGLALGSLAIADEEPALAAKILSLARAGIGHGLAPYAPDGVYPEGPSYWSYGTSYQVLLIAALESALGTDWNLAAHPGFLPSAGFVLQATGPGGRYYNFADGRERGVLNPALFWFAGRLGDPGLLMFAKRRLDAAGEDESGRFSPLVALWWPEVGLAETGPRLPLRWHGRGVNPVGVFRESWTDPSAYYLAFKGGAAEGNHAHMDAGSFVFEADGVRWAIDLGLQEYESLESKGVSLWDRDQDSQRWDVYRLGQQSHSTLSIGGERHRVEGHAAITHFSNDAADPRAIVDLTSVFAGQAARVRRGFRMLADRSALIVDELDGLSTGASVRWQMPTRSEITTNGAGATLRQDGRALRAQLLGGSDTVFATAPADPPDDGFNAPNPGVTMLSATFTAPASGSLRIAVVLSPEDSPVAAPEVTSLDSWMKPSDRTAAPKPLYRDPIHDGAADPVVIWNPTVKRWWMFYTNRRANVPGLSGVAWVHGCRIEIAESADGGVTWSYLGTAKVELPPEIGGDEPTHWAPDVITAPGGMHHMFLTVVPGVFESWQHPRRIVHLTSSDLRNWKHESALELASDRVIDACVFPLPGGGWRMWYNNERDGKSIYYADSTDLFAWTDKGKCTGVGERPGEGPYVFEWKDAHWMIVDLWRGLGVYRSDDLLHWTAQPDDLLGTPGNGSDDGVNGGHACVVVNDDRAFLFYFTHPGRNGTISPDDKDNLELRRSSIQVVELFEKDGRLTCDRDAPTMINLVAHKS